MELLAKVWPQWKVVKELGEGSFGKVYEIERKDVGGVYKAALKVITIPKNASEVKDIMSEGMDMNSATQYFHGMMEEIVKEFAMMEKLKGNTNIVAYEDHEVVNHEESIGWDILIRMELLTPLADYIMNQELSEQQIVKLGIDICKALELCKQYNIIHRDIKPENIFVSELGDYKLGDFGVARTAEKTMSGMSKKGTYTYMAPEVYKGEAYNATVDLYSLGIVLYRLVNDNRTPFLPPAPQMISFSDREKAQARRMEGETLPQPSKASEALTAIIRKACAFNPKERYADATQMRIALEGLLKGEVVVPAPVVEEDPFDKTVAMSASVVANTMAKEIKEEKVVPPVGIMEQEDKTVSMATQPVVQPVVEQKEVPTNAKKKSKLGLWAGIGVAAVALIVGGVLLLGGGKVGDNKESQGGDKQVSTEKDGVVPESQGTIDNVVEEIPDDFNILATQIALDSEGRAYVMEGGGAMAHDNSMYPPISMLGTWELENGGDGNNQPHPAEGSRITLEDGGQVLAEIECLPFYLDLSGYMDDIDIQNLVSKDIEEKHLDGMYNGYVRYYENYSDVNKKNDYIYSDILFDTHGDTLAIGIPYSMDGETIKIWEIKYDMEWVGWKLKLTHGDYSATYVPSFFTKEHTGTPFYISLFAPVASSEPLDSIVSISKYEFTNPQKLGHIQVYSPEYTMLDVAMDFKEDGTAKIVTKEKETREYRYPETTYNCQYRVSEDALTLIVDGKSYIYADGGNWWNNILEQYITEDADGLDKKVVEKVVENQNTILQKLKEAFAAAGIEVSIDENTGKVTMDSSILFGHDDSTLSQEGKDFLDKFLGVYASVILSDECAGFVSEIEVEGHTDTSGAYDYNLVLSKDRADSVANYCLQESNSGLDATQLATFGNMMKTVGRSYDEPVYNADGTVNMDASRRVVFRFRLSTDV